MITGVASRNFGIDSHFGDKFQVPSGSREEA